MNETLVIIDERPNVVIEDNRPTVAISAPGPQGPRGPQNLHVGPEAPVFLEPGLWIQTGLGDGTDFTFWFTEAE